MPTYTYRCTKCGDEVEAFQSMSDPPLRRCKKCKGALRRTFNPVGIVLKGSGFHRNDYRSKSSSSSRSESKESSSEKKESSSEKKADNAEKKDSSKSDAKTSGSSKGSDD